MAGETQNPTGRTALLKTETNKQTNKQTKNQQQQQPIRGQLLLCVPHAAENFLQYVGQQNVNFLL